MKRQRISNGEESVTTDHAAAATGNATRKMMRSKVVGAEPDHRNKDGGGGEATSNINAAAATATMGNCASASAVAPAVERGYYNYLYNGGEADHRHGGVLDYEQMWWSSIWLPCFDVDHYRVDDYAAAVNDCVLWDIDDIWNLKSIKYTESGI
ncbi:unnamed protein product [Linum trigynum]|uniref:Uncharacterized protein n=1 Tax=Linum trigynum TaxID=586398 RepID=A0AAV2F3B8_9ROSI